MAAFFRMTACAAAGFVFLLFNLDDLFGYAARHWSAQPQVTAVLLWLWKEPGRLLHVSDASVLRNMAALTLAGLWVYVAGLGLLSLARRSALVLAGGVACLGAGTLAITIVSWVAVGVVRAALAVWPLIMWIGNLLAAIWHFLAPILIVLALIVVAIWLLVTLVPLLREAGWKGIAAFIAILAGTLVAQAIVTAVLLFLWRLLATVLGFVLAALAWLFHLVFVLFVAISAASIAAGLVISVGQLVLDQFRTAWHCGRNHTAVCIGSLAIGVALSLVLWQASGSPAFSTAIDQAWHSTGVAARDASPTGVFVWSVASDARGTSSSLLVGNPGPTFDTLVLALALLVSIAGLARGLFKAETHDPHPVRFVNEIGLVLMALPLAVVFGLVATHDQN